MPIPKNAVSFVEALESYRLLVERGFETNDVIPRVEFAKRGIKYMRLLLHFRDPPKSKSDVWVDSFVEKSTGNIYAPQSFTRPLIKAEALMGNIYQLEKNLRKSEACAG